MRIESKDLMYALLNRGEFGNTFQNWEGWEAFYASGYTGLCSVRSKRTADPIRLYDVSWASVYLGIKRGKIPYDCVFYEATPHKTRVIQGELMRDQIGRLCFLYSKVRLPMRLAFSEQQIQSFGLQADHILRSNLDHGSYEDLMILLDKYEGAVIEFTTFRVPVGILQRRTVIWEVRHY